MSFEESGPPLGSPKDKPSGLKKILFFTSSEYGQANVILAVMYELLLMKKYEIHVMSFESLKSRIKLLNQQASTEESHAAIFHTIPGLSMAQALDRNTDHIGPFPPGLRGAQDTYRMMLPAMVTAWNGPEYMIGYEACLETIRSLNPDTIVVDPIHDQGLQACQTLSRKYIMLSPNTLQDILRKRQPFLSQFLRYPALSSGFPYPVPWSLVLSNIYIKLKMIWILITSPKIKGLMKFRKSQNLPALPPTFNLWQKENHHLVPAIPETDFPCKLEANVTPCGPILLPVSPVSKVDPELEAWLEQGPTVLINLGSHIKTDGQMAREFAVALKVLLDRRPKIQVLWKLKTTGKTLPFKEPKAQNSTTANMDEEFSMGSLETIATEIGSGRVKILEWLSVDPLAVLQSGHAVCSVHHGGSNSFHEALSVGVPQIILPVWLDTFEFANRAEYLGIGVYASKTAAPRVDAWELSRALMRVLGDGDEAAKMNRKAKELALVCGKVGGRVKACETIISILENGSREF
ncbi:hypothetical protein HYFRA_00012130 [Hymenoscyphus fraxineus]|uniref:Erythromycin biosynthesis protein CIII-like C-terminal domain-containing protein n=1 Tax=Hymenoscyphus fraxineus TaxID=746836 RepID=A0A9N9PXK5_9HELO|nr:hypothetical protein HYFRA_00012130 [Hymenoscyphus fraxineus]